MNWEKPYKLLVLTGVFILTVIILLFINPIPQDLSYHNFSDKRTFFGIPHFFDVISNIPFLLVGIAGLRQAGKAYLLKPINYFLISFTLFSGVLLTALGSMYYHYSPNNFTLIWDRLPMTLVFTAFFASILYDYVGKRVGGFAFYPLLLLGIYSIFYWYYTELTGAGDLRWYALVQFFPMIAIPLILVFYRTNSQRYIRYLLWIFAAYILAKLTEHFDKEIFEYLTLISGHTIKHLFSALACYFIYQLYLIRNRT